MYKVLYRAYRPETFGQVLGQEHIIKVLKNQIINNQMNHAYLFCGTRGTGKTTMARLLAKGVNCTSQAENRPCGVCSNCLSIKEGTFPDLIEIDAASNNGVDNIRELRESVKYPPIIGNKKVYIIDEVHMLSTGAFNALLKTLEEPPEDVIFILATTEPEKLPPTILSRCMRMDFRRVPENIFIERIKDICNEKEITIEDSALRLIGMNADGSVRDGLTILDQCISSSEGEITREKVLFALGAVGEEIYIELTEAVYKQQVEEGLILIDKLISQGRDPRQIIKGWISHYRNLLMIKYIKNPEDMLNMSSENVERVRGQSENIELREINKAIIQLSQTDFDSRHSSQPRILLEICLVKMSTDNVEVLSNKREVIKSQVSNEPIQKKEPAKNKIPKEEKTEVLDEKFNAEDVWRKFLDLGQHELGASFGIIRANSKLIAITPREVIVDASGMAKMAIKKYLEELENILESIMDERKIIKFSEDDHKQDDVDIEEIASKAESALGIDIEIK